MSAPGDRYDLAVIGGAVGVLLKVVA